MTVSSLRLKNLGGHQKNVPAPVSKFPLQFRRMCLEKVDLNMEITGLSICLGEGKPSLPHKVVILTG